MKKTFKNFFVIVFCFLFMFGFDSTLIQNFSEYTPPPSRYSPPEMPHYYEGTPKPAYTPPPPPPRKNPANKK